MAEKAEQADVVIIGGGPAGYAAALYGASAGLRITLIECGKVGGTCLHRGCIPAKEYLETAAMMRAVQHANAFGVSVDGVDGDIKPVINFAHSQARKQTVVDQLHKGLSGTLKRRKINIIDGFGQLCADKSVRVLDESGDERERIVAKNVILAAGSLPRSIPGFDIDGKFVVTSDDVLSWDVLPKSAAIIGGGAIGCEFASMLRDCGTEVTLLEALPKLLALCDADAASVVEKSFAKRGIAIHTGVKELSHETNEKTTRVSWTANDGSAQSTDVETIIVSVGRMPNTSNLFADNTGVIINDRGFVEVDARMRTAVNGVWAIGDIVPTPALAHVGFAEGMVAIRDILGEDPNPIDYDLVPWCIYTHPEIAYAGMTEQAAREAGIEIVVKKDPYAGNGRAMIIGETEGLVKVIAEKRPDGTAGKLLGVHLAGPWVTEQLGQGYLAVNWEATPDDIAPFIQPHPSLSETFGETIIALTGRGLHVG